jgi:hypothetical protein
VSEHPALKFGEAIHLAAPLAIEVSVEEAVKAFETLWGEEQEAFGDLKRNVDRATEMLRDIRKTHQANEFPYEFVSPPESGVELSKRVSEWEVAFAVDVGLPVPLVGRIDGLVRSKFDHKLWPWELKTSSEISTRLLAGFQHSPQVLGYGLVSRTLTGEDVEGVVVEAMRVSKTSAETSVFPVSFREHELQAFLKWARWIGTQLLLCEQREDFPQDVSACTPYPQFGMPGYQCDFFPLCSQVENWTQLKDLYAVKEEYEVVKSTTVKF